MKMQSGCVKNLLAVLVFASFELIRRRWALVTEATGFQSKDLPPPGVLK